MIPSRVRWATGLAFVLQGAFIITARYRLSYDAYNHMFFGDHYRLDWWTLWEPRWYTGFEITSYPPLVHQLIGLFGRPDRGRRCLRFDFVGGADGLSAGGLCF